ncbi:MFS transporter [Sphingomonas sp. IC081]|uniref:MFS transporter n=1 Tax=Sphingomonas sp. IC081 TaxID=304378 RepID=UPI001159AC76|nr:MFS transporter [Sphingomonas sp. IC081]
MIKAQQNRAIVAGALLYCSASLIFYIVPAFLRSIARLYDASPAQLGMLSAMEFWAIAAASLTGPLWINRFNWRTIARVGAAIALIGQVASLFVRDFDTLVIVRLLTGAFGEGLVLAVSYPVLAQSRHVERSFGLAYGATLVLSTVLIYASPLLDRLSGTVSLLLIMAVLFAASFVAASFLPAGSGNSAEESQQEITASRPVSRGLIALTLAAPTLWFAGAGGFWAFTGQIAAGNGLPDAQVATSIAIGTGLAILGTLFAMTVGDRFGRRWPVVVSALAMSALVFGVVQSGEFATLTVELALFNISWASGTIFLIAAVCAVDASGKVTVLLPAFQTIGMAFGTFILGHVIGDMGIAAVPWAVTGFLAAVLLALFTTTAIQKFRLKQEA